MANAVLEGKYYKKAIVDTAPAAGGYYTAEVPESIVRSIDNKSLQFSVTEGAGDVYLQSKGAGESNWADHEDSPYTAVTQVSINGKSHDRVWRGICKEGDYTSGDLTFGFEW